VGKSIINDIFESFRVYWKQSWTTRKTRRSIVRDCIRLSEGGDIPQNFWETKFSFGISTGTVEIIRKACRQEKVTVE
jgi:hypothetical protein